MKLAEWFQSKNSDGTKRLKGDFADRIGVSPGMVSEYCSGTAWPSREVMERITVETAGAVTANDFLQGEAAECAR